MNHVITVKVLPPAWLGLAKEDVAYFKSLKEPEDIEKINYQESISFDFGFDIINYSVNKKNRP